MYAEQIVCLQNLPLDKERNFSVLSKSSDVLNSEIEEIKSKMEELMLIAYDEKIRLLYVFKDYFYYYYLSSGKYCISKLYSVENIFSKITNSNDNYVMESLIFDENDETNIVKFMNDDINKKMSLYQEWDEKGVPKEIPKVKVLEEKDDLNFSEIDLFQIKEILKLIIYCYDNKLNTYQYVKSKYLYILYKIIFHVLPKKIKEELVLGIYTNLYSSNLISDAYCSMTYNDEYFKEKYDLGKKRVKSDPPYNFGYEDDISIFSISFDKDSEFIRNVEMSSSTTYIEDYINFFVRQLINFNNVSKIVKDVEEISDKYSLGLHDALNMYLAINNRLEEIKNIFNLEDVIEYIEEQDISICKNLANSLYKYMYRIKEWAFQSNKLKLYQFTKKYSEVIPVSINEFHKKLINITFELEEYGFFNFRHKKIIDDIYDNKFYDVLIDSELMEVCLKEVLELYLLLVNDESYERLYYKLVFPLIELENFMKTFYGVISEFSKEKQCLLIGYLVASAYEFDCKTNEYLLFLIHSLQSDYFYISQQVTVDYMPEKLRNKTQKALWNLFKGKLHNKFLDSFLKK